MENFIQNAIDIYNHASSEIPNVKTKPQKYEWVLF